MPGLDLCALAGSWPFGGDARPLTETYRELVELMEDMMKGCVLESGRRPAVVFCADLNSLPGSDAYKLITRKLCDASFGHAGGEYFQGSFSTLKPDVYWFAAPRGQRSEPPEWHWQEGRQEVIDYIFHSQDLTLETPVVLPRMPEVPDRPPKRHKPEGGLYGYWCGGWRFADSPVPGLEEHRRNYRWRPPRVNGELQLGIPNRIHGSDHLPIVCELEPEFVLWIVCLRIAMGFRIVRKLLVCLLPAVLAATEDDYKRDFAEFDHNKDGQIDFQELRLQVKGELDATHLRRLVMVTLLQSRHGQGKGIADFLFMPSPDQSGAISLDSRLRVGGSQHISPQGIYRSCSGTSLRSGQKGFLLALLPLRLAERTRYVEKEALEFPTTCDGGVLDLDGAYEVSKFTRINVAKSCILRGSSQTVIEMQENASLLFVTANDADVTLEGHLQFTVAAHAALSDPCLKVVGNLTIATDELSIARCSGEGSIYVTKDLQIRGNGQIVDSYSSNSGGAVRVSGSVEQHSGSLIVTNCSSMSSGGAIYVKESYVQLGGSLAFAHCSSKRSGGAMYVEKSYQQLGGSVSFADCSSVDDDSTVENLKKDDNYPSGGGGLFVGEALLQKAGLMRFENCSTKFHGGGLLARKRKGWAMNGWLATLAGNSFLSRSHSFEPPPIRLLQSGRAVMLFRNCTAAGRGGGAAVSGRAKIQGSMLFDKCSTNVSHGGGLHVSHELELSGNLTATSCHSGDDGGGLHARRGLRQIAGSMRFQDCSCQKKGGGIKVDKAGLRMSGGQRIFDNCSAEMSGGAIYVHYEGVELKGNISFKECRAKREGGAVFVQYRGFNESSATSSLLSFVNCTAGSRAGALQVGGNSSFSSPVHLSHCRDSSSTPFSVAGWLTLGRVDIVETGDQPVTVSADKLIIREANCSGAGQCQFSSVKPEVPNLGCTLGRGRREDRAEGALVSGEVGCRTCAAGRIQIDTFNKTVPNAPCVKCPGGTRLCTSDKVVMQRGYMVSQSNLSRHYHCPNKFACPGGDLPEAETAMCAEGYYGLGCTNCLDSHGPVDNTVLSCTPCPTTGSMWAWQVFFCIVKDVVIFVLAISGVMQASEEGKPSTVLLNQLMSFSTVAGTALSAVKQTGSFGKLSNRLQSMLVSSGMMVDVVQGGQSSGLSTVCLAEFVGLPKTLWMAHILRSATPALLIVVLSIYKDPWLALVVGANCFLPEFCAGFGKYLVCYRIEKEKRGGELTCAFLPDIPAATATITGMIVLCFLLALFGWTKAALSKTSPKPPHVVYLTNAYKDKFAAWEVERLVRKMLLTLVGAVLPITLSPALQLGCLSVILVVSLVAYVHLLPYKQNAFNLIEAALLADALVIAALSNSLLANDSNWAKTESTNLILLFFTAFLSVAGAGLMLLLLIRAYLRERRMKPKQASK
ncbi:CCR4 [Symbiodinium sp. CCMP2592]|nr:CCR4 [Symbiodinium sp. CCMP2592]